MFGLSPIHLIFLAVVALVVFGRGKISEFMGDFGKGIKSFKEGMADETTVHPAAPPPQIGTQTPAAPPASAPPAPTQVAPAETTSEPTQPPPR